MTLKKNVLASVFVFVLCLIVSSFVLLPTQASAEDQTFDWVKLGLSSNETSFSLFKSTATDLENNVYVAGFFNGTVDFNPDNEGGELTSSGDPDIFVVKYNSSGIFQWAKKSQSQSGYNEATSIKIDSNGNIYTIGKFYNTIDFNPDNEGGELTLLGNSDIFVMKYNSAGVFQWVKQIGGTGSDEGVSVDIDIDGNIYTTGSFSGTADFNSDIEGGELTSLGDSDIFVVKYNSAGVFQWVKQMGGTDFEYLFSADIGFDGNIYATGKFRGTADFNIGTEGGELTSLGDLDIFVVKYNSAGVFQWVKQSGGALRDYGNSISTYKNGDAFVTGCFNGTSTFGEGENEVSLESKGGRDLFIAKYDTYGNFEWVKQIGGTGNEEGYSVSIDSDNNIYIAGNFIGTADFNPGTGEDEIYNLTTTEETTFITKLDSYGNFIFAKQLELTGNDRPWIYTYSTQIDGDNNIYMGGEFGGTIDFNTEEEVLELTSGPGGDDAFLLKLSFPAPLIETPTLVTASATSITQSSATLTGEVSDNGGEDLSELGFQIGLDTSYLMATGTVEIEEATGTFSYTYEIDLDCNTTYHFRAYGTNSAGTSYGEDMTFTTSSCPVVDEEDNNIRRHSRVIGSMPKVVESSPVVSTTPISTVKTLNIKRLLKLNITGDDVKELQAWLNNHGYPISLTGAGSKGYETTKFGPLTKKAVILFQKANGLTPDGIVGSKTLEKMK